MEFNSIIHDVKSGRKYWSPVGVPITVPYTGSHKRITAYGSITIGRQFFRTASTHPLLLRILRPAETFWEGSRLIGRPRTAQKPSGRCCTRNIKIIYLPKGSPYLNGRMLAPRKAGPLVSEYYKTFFAQCRSQYFARFIIK